MFVKPLHKKNRRLFFSSIFWMTGQCLRPDLPFTLSRVLGKLPCKVVLHAVGPVWHGGDRDEATLLGDCVRNCLAAADKKGAALPRPPRENALRLFL